LHEEDEREDQGRKRHQDGVEAIHREERSVPQRASEIERIGRRPAARAVPAHRGRGGERKDRERERDPMTSRRRS
jgi:hypothetical protein